MSIAMAKHILVRTKEEADALKTKLDHGEKFDLLAKKYSLCASKKKRR
jgi:peptidyl-prolyl cis-trans isomerase C